MADKNGRERLGLYFNINNPKEKELWDYLEEKYSKSAFVKEAIEEKMLRERNGIIINKIEIKEDQETKTSIENPNKIKKAINDTGMGVL